MRDSIDELTSEILCGDLVKANGSVKRELSEKSWRRRADHLIFRHKLSCSSVSRSPRTRELPLSTYIVAHQNISKLNRQTVYPFTVIVEEEVWSREPGKARERHGPSGRVLFRRTIAQC